MTPLQLLQARLIQTLHDPPHKALVLGTGTAHQAAALAFARAVAGRELRAWNHAPDRLASGADRPVLGGGREAHAYWRKAPVITHPLQPEARLLVSLDGLPAAAGVRAQNDEILRLLSEPWVEDDSPETGLPALGEAGWNDPAALRRTQLALWRNLPELVRGLRLPAAFLPADTRCPDHSIESHLRVSAAAAFVEPLDRPEDRRDPAREPVLLQVSVRGVQSYIRESRKARDLWTACMIFTELAWAAMAVIVEQYGPEAVLYPDLRENPLMDQWLLARGHTEAVPERVRRAGAGTFAAPVPNTFCALVPRGGGALEPVEALAERCAQAVRDRWSQMAGSVERLLLRSRGDGPWRQIYARQLDPGRAPEVVWAAVPWRRRMVGLEDPPANLAALPGHAVPPDALPAPLVERAAALQPWLPDRVWRHYQTALTVFWRTDAAAEKRYLRDERGFDYAVVHHQLRRVIETRKLHEAPAPSEEPGEKCALTGVDEALSNRPAGAGRDVRVDRGEARRFWRTGPEGADPVGEERLGGPAALKRLLARADDETFLARWRGVREGATEEADAPFPSTSALAMGRFLVEIGKRWDDSPALRQAARDVLDAVGQTSTDADTLHPLALPRLWSLAQGRPDLARFYRLEPQHLLPEVASAHRDRAPKDSPERARRQRTLDVLKAFYKVCKGLDIARPRTAIAILAMDGDSLSRLVLGDPDTIQARWRDVLHPDVVARIEQGWGGERPALAATGWRGLLEERRTMGPSLHAALTSALAFFTHHVAGWVVEREHGGRLIYAGGDDLLAMLPADEALRCAARLQQLASAPFLLDTAPETVPWAWRLGGDEDRPSPDGARERGRFHVPTPGIGDPQPLSALAWEQPANGSEPAAPPDLRAPWDLKMMLGRANGLSAGISMGHYKTPLGTLVRAAKEALDEIAKKRTAPKADGQRREVVKRAVAISRFTRGGSKYSFCAGWELQGDAPPLSAERPWRPGPPQVQRTLRTVVEGIRKGKLPSRLPYKLREDLAMVGSALKDQNSHELLSNLVRINAPLADEQQRAAVVALLEAGRARAKETTENLDQLLVAGLLLARDLEADGADDAHP